MRIILRAVCALLLLTSLRLMVWADEGMWTFDNPPLKALKERYGFVPTAEWLDHLRLSTVRFNDGGSGSFVGPDGLVLTNHHVAEVQIQKLSSAGKDYARNGFHAASREEELRCPDLELNLLVSMEDVTERIRSAVKPGPDDAEGLRARIAAVARIEKESLDKTGLRSEVVKLYQGGEYWLYRYKEYTDVRLVFAPEAQAAFFGGDPDNFTYPRYCLDFALVRVYEDGKPLRQSHYLKWNSHGVLDRDLVFVVGNPASTHRLSTLAQLEYRRDIYYPTILGSLKRRLDVLARYGSRGEEQTRQAGGLKLGLENGVKALSGEFEGLKNPAVLAKKAEEERAFRDLVQSKPEWQREFGDAWDRIAAAQGKRRERFKSIFHHSLQRSQSPAPGLALALVRYPTELKKPDGERLAGYHDAQIPSLRLRVLSKAPLYLELEQMLVQDAWQEALDALGPDDPFLKLALGGRTPADAARAAFEGTKIADPEFRRSLFEGGEGAIASSTDPLIALARTVDPLLREEQRWFEKEIESVETAGGERLGKARFAAYGKSLPPDATFTPRLAYGAIKGYPMNGTLAPYKTSLYGLYERATAFDGRPPFDLPHRFEERRNRLNLDTPVNFVTTCDISGGNSGSPVVNRAGEIVGLIFDGNIESLAGDYVYDEEKSRSVAVAAAYITEGLRKLYDAAHLAEELEGALSPALSQREREHAAPETAGRRSAAFPTPRSSKRRPRGFARVRS